MRRYTNVANIKAHTFDTVGNVAVAQFGHERLVELTTNVWRSCSVEVWTPPRCLGK